MRHSMTSRLSVFVLVAAFTLALPFLSAAQNQASFTAEDVLDVTNVSVADISDDGRWIAATVASLRDRIGIDNSRFGDPTYFAPSNVDALVIDTQTGKTQKLFTEKRQVRQLKWSPDGSRLAMLALKGETFEPMIWERANNRWQTVKLPPAKSAAENSELTWTPAGDQLLLTLRPDEQIGDTLRRLACLPVGATPRSPLSNSPGISLPGGALPRDVAFVRQDIACDPSVQDCPYRPDLAADDATTGWLPAAPSVWVGDFAWILGGVRVSPGFAVPVSFRDGSYRTGLLFYLAFEHRLRPQRRPRIAQGGSEPIR